MKQKGPACRQAGISLIELLVVMAISAIAGTLLIMILVQNNGLFLKQTNKINQGVNANDVVNLLSQDIKAASFVAANYPEINPSYTTSSSTLILAVPSIDVSDDIIKDTYDYLIFTPDLSNSLFFRKLVFPDSLSARKSADTILTIKLKNISFVYLDKAGNAVSPTSAAKVNFSLTLKGESGFASEENEASSEVKLRNF